MPDVIQNMKKGRRGAGESKKTEQCEAPPENCRKQKGRGCCPRPFLFFGNPIFGDVWLAGEDAWPRLRLTLAVGLSEVG